MESSIPTVDLNIPNCTKLYFKHLYPLRLLELNVDILLGSLDEIFNQIAEKQKKLRCQTKCPTSHNVRMHRVIFYISNVLRKVMI